eukprot:7339446-Prorocentrum_lima.AAC.1
MACKLPCVPCAQSMQENSGHSAATQIQQSNVTAARVPRTWKHRCAFWQRVINTPMTQGQPGVL